MLNKTAIMSQQHYAQRALQLLQDNHTDPSSLMIRLQQSPSITQSFLDETTQTRWNYIIRRRSRLFLLAKSDDSAKYIEIYSMSTK